MDTRAGKRLVFGAGGYSFQDVWEFMTYHALISPQGNTEYNAEFVVGDVSKLENGKFYTAQELANICGCAYFIKDSSCATEKNIKKWRYEVQE